MKYTYIVLLMFWVLFSCKKENTFTFVPPETETPCIICPDTTENKLEVLWKLPLHLDTRKVISTEPILVNEDVIFTSEVAFEDGQEVIAYNIKGTENWRKNNPLPSSIPNLNGLYNYNNNIVVKTAQSKICLFDEALNQEEWCYNPKDYGFKSYGGIKIIDDSYFRIHYEGGIIPETEHLVRASLSNGQIETVFTAEESGEYTPSLGLPEKWINPEEKTYWIFSQVDYLWGTNEPGISTVYKMSADTKEIEQTWNNLNSAVSKLIWNNLLFLGNYDSIYCMDLVSENILWKEYRGQNIFAQPLIEEGVLVINPDDRRIMGLDPHTGATLWSHDDSGSTSSTMVAHDGIVYFGSLGRGRLYAVDVHTGEHIWAEKSPFIDEYHNAAFLNGVAIDTVNNMLFTDDSYFAMGIKLPER